MPRAGAEIVPIDDTGAVAEPVMADAAYTEIINVEIIGVPQLDSYRACLKCKARVEPLTPPLGKCSKLGCGMMQRYDRCQKQLSAKLMVMWSDDENGVCTQSLFAYGKTVSGLAGIDEGDDDSLVSSELFLNSARIALITYNENNMITKFSRAIE